MFAEDLTVFFTDFAVPAVFTTSGGDVSADVIFNTPTRGVDVYGTQVEAEGPYLTVPTADISTVGNRDTVTIDSVVYTIERIEQLADGKISRVYLRT